MIRPLVASAHPGPSGAVSTISALLALGVGLPPVMAGLLTAAVLAGQLSVGWSNDAIDAGRDAQVGRTDKPAAVGAVTVRRLWQAAVVAAAAAVTLSMMLGVLAGAVVLLLPAAGWAYNLGLKGSWWSAGAYAVGFGALPAACYLAAGHRPLWWASVVGALLGVAAHMTNALPDLTDDVQAGVRGVPQRLGRRGSLAVVVAALLAAAVLTVAAAGSRRSAVLIIGSAVAAAASIGCAALGWRRQRSEAAFYGVVVVALLDVALLVIAT